MNKKVILEDGKYEITYNDGVMHFKRNGEVWDAANCDYAYSKLVGALVSRVIELEEKIT